METERKVVLVSVNVEDGDVSKIGTIGAHLDEGWEVKGTIPLSGSDMGPGSSGEYEMLRMQVILERKVDANGVVQQAGSDAGDHTSDSAA